MLNSKLTWKKATWTPVYPSVTSAKFTEVAVPELAGATEVILFIGSSSLDNVQLVYINAACTADDIRIYTANQFFGPSNTNYDEYVGFKFVKSTNVIGFRQTYKGTSATWIGIKEIWYR